MNRALGAIRVSGEETFICKKKGMTIVIDFIASDITMPHVQTCTLISWQYVLPPLLVQCWASVVDGGPTLNQQWLKNVVTVVLTLKVLRYPFKIFTHVEGGPTHICNKLNNCKHLQLNIC